MIELQVTHMFTGGRKACEYLPGVFVVESDLVVCKISMPKWGVSVEPISTGETFQVAEKQILKAEDLFENKAP